VPVGLLTEGVEGTHLLEDDQVEPSLAHLPASAAALLAGQTTDAEGPCGVLDLDAVFRLSEALPRARRAG
jgi:chemotaxis signal transduction protein